MSPQDWSSVANRRSPARQRLEELLPQARAEHWPPEALAEAVGTSYNNLRQIIWRLRQDAEKAGQPDPWPTGDARHRETYLNELIAVTGVAPRDAQCTELRYLKQLSRKEQGLTHYISSTILENFRSRLLDGGMVVDLRREDGDGYRRGDVWVRPARDGEEGRIIAGG